MCSSDPGVHCDACAAGCYAQKVGSKLHWQSLGADAILTARVWCDQFSKNSTNAGEQQHLASLLLEDLLFLPACTELLLQLFNGNLQQGGTNLSVQGYVCKAILAIRRAVLALPWS